MNAEGFLKISIKAAESEQTTDTTFIDSEIDIATRLGIAFGIGAKEEHPLHAVAFGDFSHNCFNFFNGKNPFHS